MSSGELAIRYVVTGAIALLRMPETRTARRVDELWRRTCCELLIASTASAAYCEFNFSPSSEWAAYEFDAYRQGMRPLSLQRPPRIAVTSSESQWRLDVSLEPDDTRHDAILALCAVIETNDDQVSYWALAHPPGKPDFHHRDGFKFKL